MNRTNTKFVSLAIALLMGVLFAFAIFACGGDDDVQPPPAALKMTVSPKSINADGISTAVVSLKGRGTDGKPLPDGTQVTFTTKTEYGKFHNNQTKITAEIKSGETQVLFIAGTTPGFGFIGADTETPKLAAGEKITLLSAHKKDEPRDTGDGVEPSECVTFCKQVYKCIEIGGDSKQCAAECDSGKMADEYGEDFFCCGKLNNCIDFSNCLNDNTQCL